MNPLRGIGFKVFSVVLFLMMFACIKQTAGAIPAGEAVFFRSLFAIPPILLWIIWRSGSLQTLPAQLATKDPFSHLWRGLIGTSAMALGFVGLTRLPLSEAVAIGYAAPLLVTVFAAMFLGEKVRLYRLTAVLLGFVGVMLVLSPRLISEGAVDPTGTTDNSRELLGALACACAAVLSALAQVFVRNLIRTEKTSAIVFWFSISSAGLALATLPFGWAWPSVTETTLLVTAGLLGGIGQIFLTESYRHAEIAVIAPFEYTSMLFALIIGYLLFDEIPTGIVLCGAAIVILAGCLIVLREHRLGMQRRGARALIPPQS